MSLQFVGCEMAKQKRKESEVAEKKSKKLKKVSAVETPAACAAPPGPGTAPAEVGAEGTARWPRLSPDLGGHSVVVWLVSGWTVPGRHAWCRCSRGTVRAAGACRAEPQSRAFSASRPRGAGAVCSWALRPSHGDGALAWGSVCVWRLHLNVF